MVRHIVAWNYLDGFTKDQNEENAREVKQQLESLAGKVEGIIELKVYINILPSGNRDVILNSLFESEEALSAYQVHPEHQRVSSFVGSVMQNRACVDYHE